MGLLAGFAGIIWILAFTVGAIFCFIARLFGKKTPRIKFMQRRVEGLINFLLTPLWIALLFKVISMNGFSEDVGGKYKFIDEHIWNWLGLFWFIGNSCAGFLLKLGMYRVWFTDFASLSNEDRMKLFQMYQKD